MNDAVSENIADYLTTATAARALGIAEQTVRLWVRRGDLPAIRLSSGLRIYRRADVDRLRVARAAAKVQHTE